jgi:hypothetical protein
MIPGKAMLLLTTALLFWACATGRKRVAEIPDEPLGDFKGLFAGNAISSDGRRVKLVLDIQRNGRELTGNYSCAAGNANCRNQMTQGRVKGSVDESIFRVSLQDGSWCLFNLGMFYLNEGEGDYTCYLGGSIVEQGAFELKRVVPQ